VNKTSGYVESVKEGKNNWRGVKLDNGDFVGGFCFDLVNEGDYVEIEYENNTWQGNPVKGGKSCSIDKEKTAEAAEKAEEAAPTQEKEAPAQEERSPKRGRVPDLKALITEELDELHNALSMASNYKRFKELPDEVLEKYVVCSYLQAKKERYWATQPQGGGF